MDASRSVYGCTGDSNMPATILCVTLHRHLREDLGLEDAGPSPSVRGMIHSLGRKDWHTLAAGTGRGRARTR